MTITLGPIRIERVTEVDHWPFPPAALFPAVTPRHLCCGNGDLDLSITTHVVRTPDAVVLVDSGNGNAKQRPTLPPHHMFATDYLDRLVTTGIHPEDIDVVVSTHLHPDHCSGNTRLVDREWVPTFPRARYLFSRTEYAWLESIHAAAPVEGPAAALAATFADSVLPIVNAGLADLVDIPATVVEGVDLVALPGHTAGHLIAEITGGGVTALVTGDVLHHPLQFTDLTLAQAGDADPHLAALSRRTLCDSAADADAVVLPAHFGGPDGGRITRAGDGFRYADR